MFPAYLRDGGLGISGNEIQRRPNLSGAAQRYLHRIGADLEDLFHHVLATLHDPAYRKANAGALRMEWPRIPLPGWPDGEADGAPEALAASAARGRELARLLDPDTPVPSVTQGALRPEVAAIAVPSTTDGRNMTGDDFAITAGWGHYGTGEAVMPGQGRIVEREYTPEERAALGNSITTLGARTLDVYLNDRAFWRNVPAAIWGYKLGGYQVLKKWVSYRERDVLGRALSPEEVMYFAEMARRVAELLSLATPAPPAAAGAWPIRRRAGSTMCCPGCRCASGCSAFRGHLSGHWHSQQGHPASADSTVCRRNVPARRGPLFLLGRLSGRRQRE